MLGWRPIDHDLRDKFCKKCQQHLPRNLGGIKGAGACYGDAAASQARNGQYSRLYQLKITESSDGNPTVTQQPFKLDAKRDGDFMKYPRAAFHEKVAEIDKIVSKARLNKKQHRPYMQTFMNESERLAVRKVFYDINMYMMLDFQTWFKFKDGKYSDFDIKGFRKNHFSYFSKDDVAMREFFNAVWPEESDGN